MNFPTVWEKLVWFYFFGGGGAICFSTQVLFQLEDCVSPFVKVVKEKKNRDIYNTHMQQNKTKRPSKSTAR